jgi:PRC-barrel domain
MADSLFWIATIATVVAASMTAANLGSRITGYGFCVFLVGSLSWLTAGLMTGQPALVWTNGALTVLNIFGIWRWLGRQVKIEEGASLAAEASEQTPGEALFPVSLLVRAPIEDGQGAPLGTCVDAMAGCSSGRVRYIVASEGGLAGVGETLRRLPWEEAMNDGERMLIDRHRFESLDKIGREEWPAT